jgi:hypothetical protein
MNARMILIYPLRRDLELILSTKNVVPFGSIDVRLAFLNALGLSNGLRFTKVGYEFGSRDYSAEIGGGVLYMEAEHL